MTSTGDLTVAVAAANRIAFPERKTISARHGSLGPWQSPSQDASRTKNMLRMETMSCENSQVLDHALRPPAIGNSSWSRISPSVSPW